MSDGQAAFAALRARAVLCTANDPAQAGLSPNAVTAEAFFRLRPALRETLAFPRDLAKAAVLVALVGRKTGPTILLTRRARGMPHHPGDIVFPGGGMRPEDGSLLETALREAEEELGLDRTHVDAVGFMPAYPTVSSAALIHPLIAFLDPGFELKPCPREVAEVLEVPLAFVADASNHVTISGDFGFGFMTGVHAVIHDGRCMYGLTAHILRDLANLLKG